MSDVQFETVNDYIIACASWYIALAGIIFLATIYLIEKEWEKSVIDTIKQSNATQSFLTGEEIKENLKKRVSFDGLY